VQERVKAQNAWCLGTNGFMRRGLNEDTGEVEVVDGLASGDGKVGWKDSMAFSVCHVRDGRRTLSMLV
jgi:hypothetical protein